ncbi:hypothetical protein ACVPOR_04925 [Staphylococcus aureus]
MIAIGGAIGTGLFVATGNIISQAGPGGAILAYTCYWCHAIFLNVINWRVGNILSHIGSFSSYSTRFLTHLLALPWDGCIGHCGH